MTTSGKTSGAAREKAEDLSRQVKDKLGQARDAASAGAATAREQLSGKPAEVGQKAAALGGAAVGQLHDKAVAAGTPVWEAAPDQVKDAVTKAAGGARRNGARIAVVAAAVLSFVLLRRRRER